MPTQTFSEPQDLGPRLRAVLGRLEQLLPPQAPIRGFVHFNMLRGFLHQPLPEAAQSVQSTLGVLPFQSLEAYRDHWQRGRIVQADLDAAIAETDGDDARQEVIAGVTRKAMTQAAFLHDLTPPAEASWNWQVEEGEVLRNGSERALWTACCSLAQRLSPADGSRMRSVDDAAEAQLNSLLADIARDGNAGATFLEMLRRLTGRDVREELRPYFVRYLAAHLDQGMAAWHNPARDAGFYTAWRSSAQLDPYFDLLDLSAWQQTLERLPDDPEEAILQALHVLGLQPEQWETYLQAVAMELPGWAGMMLWRSLRPGFEGQVTPVSMVDFLAVRLALGHIYAQGISGLHFKTEASLPSLRRYLRHHPAETLVRLSLYAAELPEWLASEAHRLVREATGRHEEEDEAEWLPVARLLLAWRRGEAAPGIEHASDYTPDAWRLFRVCQCLNLDAPPLNEGGREMADSLLACMAEQTPARLAWIGLQAYEHAYSEQVLAALAANHGRGAWQTRASRPEAQLVFCMDDREEGLRRHLEERHPRIETFGAAAHYNVFVRYTGLGETPVDLCPVVARPAHTVAEVSAPGEEARAASYLRARSTIRRWKTRLIQGSRRDPLRGALASVTGAPLALTGLTVKSLSPSRATAWAAGIRRTVTGEPATRLDFVQAIASGTPPPATPDAPRPGFVTSEQVDRAAAFLSGIGLKRDFAPLFVIVGHGSHSENNPHLAAYNCGACSGQHSGPNARLLAAILNRPDVREQLRAQSIDIPEDTWFVGCEHNTCDDRIQWLDIELLPPGHLDAFRQLDAALAEAGELHAQERCRRFMSAPLDLTPKRAQRHVSDRMADFSQPRAELGHINNASAYVGRRSATRGVFLDRRMFLISYDPSTDPDGTVLEPLLLANAPVGADISYDYFCSAVANERFGSGNKVTHNVVGLLGVMEGASSDLRVGLARQMIEIHEPMRLLMVVEHRLEVLTAIYERQPLLQTLVGNGWVKMAAKDPESAAIHRFVPGKGWVPWQAPQEALPHARTSTDWVRNQRGPMPPALIDMEPVT